jgi:hypothetical protein
MLATYQGILRNNRIEWSGEGPQQLPADQSVRVHVTLLEQVTPAAPSSEQGQRMAAALEKVAASQAVEGIADPAAWERDTRQDRSLPGRDG